MAKQHSQECRDRIEEWSSPKSLKRSVDAVKMPSVEENMLVSHQTPDEEVSVCYLLTNQADGTEAGEATVVEERDSSRSRPPTRVEVEKRSAQGSDGSDSQSKKEITDVCCIMEQWVPS